MWGSWLESWNGFSSLPPPLKRRETGESSLQFLSVMPQPHRLGWHEHAHCDPSHWISHGPYLAALSLPSEPPPVTFIWWPGDRQAVMLPFYLGPVFYWGWSKCFPLCLVCGQGLVVLCLPFLLQERSNYITKCPGHATCSSTPSRFFLSPAEG